MFWIVFSRTPHKAYTEYNGTLIPIEPQAAYNYPDPYLQQPNPYNQMGGQQQHPYGQRNNSYANQPYGNPVIIGGPGVGAPQQGYVAPPTPSYGSQYPQGQYLNQYNQYQQRPQPATSYPQQQYTAQQPKSQYTVERPQAHQPYPNSPYA